MCRGSALRVGHAHCVVGIGDGVLGESLRWWSDYIDCNSEHPKKIAIKNIKKNIRGCTMLTRVVRVLYPGYREPPVTT
jgi:hypothetical protein